MIKVKAKPLVSNKFWIVEAQGQKLGTLQKNGSDSWVFLNKLESKRETHDQQSLVDRFENKLEFVDSKPVSKFAEQIHSIPGEQWEVYEYPVNTRPYNPVYDVQKQLPIYTKTLKSKSNFCAGYYIIKFPKGWRKAFCPKLITLQRYEYQGPMKSKTEMQQVLNTATKDFLKEE